MKAIFVFDNTISQQALNRLKLSRVHTIRLFPLTSDRRIIETVRKWLDHLGIEIIEILNTASLVNESVKQIKEHIQIWSKFLGNANLNDVSVKRAFTIGKKEISSYWFTLAAEKNPLKTDLFLKIAQLQAFANNLKHNRYRYCIISLGDYSLRLSAKNTARALGLVISDITKTGMALKLKYAFRSNYFVLNSGIRALGFLGRAFLWSRRARKILGPWSKDDKFEDPLLMVSYFPYIDSSSMKNGRFVNKYFAPLQRKLEYLNFTTSWLLMFVFIDGYSYQDAVRIAKRLLDMGVRLKLLEQALTLKLLIKILTAWLIQIIRFHQYRRKLIRHPIHKIMFPSSGLPLLKELLNASFCGSPAMQGVFYYFLFSKFAIGMKNTKLCIYLCEMSTWEKAFNSALSHMASHVVKIGFQHTSIGQNYFFYFSHPEDSLRTCRETDLPLPDILAVNGKIPYNLLKSSNYPRLEVVEALRQLPMVRQLRSLNEKPNKPNVLLVVASYGILETCAMLTMVLDAFPNTKGVQIWLKGHPSCSMVEVCKMLAVKPDVIGYKIVDGDIGTYLEAATMVMVSNSSVALDALAYGCRVIVPVFNDVINMSPILGNMEFYQIVTTSEDLKNIVNRFGKSKTESEIEKGRSFLRNYWCLDTDLPRWERLISDYYTT